MSLHKRRRLPAEWARKLVTKRIKALQPPRKAPLSETNTKLAAELDLIYGRGPASLRFGPPPEASPHYTDMQLPDPKTMAHDGPSEIPHHERLVLAKNAIKRAFVEDGYSLEDTLPHRVRAAWRITREMARIRGQVSEDTTLSEGLDDHEEWSQAQELMYPLPGRKNRNTLVREAVALYEEKDGRGLGIVPPPPPYEDWRVPSSYYEKHDKPLRQWCRIVRALGRSLGVSRGTEEHPNLGNLGLSPLVDYSTARMAWPSRLQIVYWEECIIQITLKLLIKHGIPGAQDYLKEQHALNRHEASTLIKLAMALGRHQTDVEIEDQRAIMILRLEDLLERAKEEMSLRAELAALKQLTLVLGLAKSDPEDAMSGFTDMVKGFDAKDAAAITIDVPSRGLPGPN